MSNISLYSNSKSVQFYSKCSHKLYKMYAYSGIPPLLTPLKSGHLQYWRHSLVPNAFTCLCTINIPKIWKPPYPVKWTGSPSPNSTWTVHNSLDNVDSCLLLSQDYVPLPVDSKIRYSISTVTHIAFLNIVWQWRGLLFMLNSPRTQYSRSLWNMDTSLF